MAAAEAGDAAVRVARACVSPALTHDPRRAQAVQAALNTEVRTGTGVDSDASSYAASTGADVGPPGQPEADDASAPAASGAGDGSGATHAGQQPAHDSDGEEGGASSSDEDSSSDDDSDEDFEVPVRSHGDWDAFVDEDSGQEYYYNRKSGETCWEAPCPEIMPPHMAALEFLSKLMSNPYDPEQPHPLSSMGPWSLYVDGESMAMYYVRAVHACAAIRFAHASPPLPRSATTTRGRRAGSRPRLGTRRWPPSRRWPS